MLVDIQRVSILFPFGDNLLVALEYTSNQEILLMKAQMHQMKPTFMRTDVSPS